MSNLTLHEAVPATKSIPRVEIAEVPTPIEKLGELGKRIGVPSLYVKRDDQTGQLYGGNKVRKLEFLIGDALEDDCSEIWTVGGLGSHHVLATAIYARHFDIDPVALHFPQPITEHVLDNLRALGTTDPELTLAGNRAKVPIEMAKVKIKEWLNLNPDMKYIPAGGSSRQGVMGYVAAAFELRDQIEADELPEPDYIFVAAGTCGTLAGLTLGCQMAGLSSRVVGIRVIDRLLSNSAIAAQLARNAAKLMGEHGVHDVPELTRSDFIVLSDYFGGEYGEPTAEGEEARQLVDETTDNLQLDPTYTAKAIAGLIGDRDMLGLAHRDVLYWHTLSSVDISDRIERADVEKQLPESYQKFFEADPDEASQ